MTTERSEPKPGRPTYDDLPWEVRLGALVAAHLRGIISVDVNTLTMYQREMERARRPR